MAEKLERGRRSRLGPAAPASREAFATSLSQRRQAAERLEKDLLTQVPLLYGSPGQAAPDLVIERLHQEELVRRSGGGILPASRRRGDAALPFERGLAVFAFSLMLLFYFAR